MAERSKELLELEHKGTPLSSLGISSILFCWGLYFVVIDLMNFVLCLQKPLFLFVIITKKNQTI